MDIILSIDYEIFGDGSGDCKHCRIEPSRRLLDVLDNYDGICSTFFVDYGELRAKRRVSKELKDGGRRKNIQECLRRTEEQLMKIVDRGHDVQLHLHPQWLGADFKDNKWDLPRRGWSTPAIIDEHGYDFFSSLLDEARGYFENLLQPVENDYRCNVFRAGGWAIQPEGEVLEALKENGFVVDSSVVPGMSKDGYDYAIDYTDAPRDRDAWWVTDSVSAPGTEDGLLEVPISSLDLLGFQRLYKENLINRKWGDAYPEGCEGNSFGRSFTVFDYLKWLISYQSAPLDFCHFTTQAMVDYLEGSDKSDRNLIVMMGHSKEFYDQDSFRSLLEQLLDLPATFTDFREFYRDFNPSGSS
ncbi:MAG: hypothetical protein ABEK50_18175 [bacterium]